MPSQGEKIKFKYGTRAEFDYLNIKDSNTYYNLLDTQEIYLGNKRLGNGKSMVCTQSQYQQMTNRDALLYFVLSGNEGHQTLKIMDSKNHIISLGAAAEKTFGTTLSANVEQPPRQISIQQNQSLNTINPTSSWTINIIEQEDTP